MYHRSIIRRVTLIQIAQKVGISLGELAEAFRGYNNDHIITAEEWRTISSNWQAQLNQRIQLLSQLRDDISECIGCGCLSLEACPLANKEDKLANLGAGAHLIKS